MKSFKRLLCSMLLLVVTAFITYIALGWWELRHPSPTATLRFIQGATGVRFPPGITQYAEFDDTEAYLTVHLTLPPTEIQPFIQQQHFNISPQMDRQLAIDRLQNVSSLPVPFKKVPTSANHVLVSCSKNHSWAFVLDSRSGNLWATIGYPDRSGDLKG